MKIRLKILLDAATKAFCVLRRCLNRWLSRLQSTAGELAIHFFSCFMLECGTYRDREELGYEEASQKLSSRYTPGKQENARLYFRQCQAAFP